MRSTDIKKPCRLLLTELPTGRETRATIRGWIEEVEHLGNQQSVVVLRDPSYKAAIDVPSASVPEPGAFVEITATFERAKDSSGTERFSAASADCRILVPPSRQVESSPTGRRVHARLRQSRLQEGLRVVDRIMWEAQKILKRNHFIHVETPYLTRSIYEYSGSDFVVCSPLWDGSVAHLAQSPQIYKQLLMAGGVERYFQFARNFRAEPGGPTHLQEFTQLDAELVADSRQEIQALIEEVVCAAVFGCTGEIVTRPFPELDASRCGSDRPSGFYWITRQAIAQRKPNGTVVPTHHVMSLPENPEGASTVSTPDDLLDLTGTGYDLMLGNLEIGGGDLRIVDAKLQRRVLSCYGLETAEIEARFGALLTAMEDGIPQHGGFAIGLTRLAMTLVGARHVDDVLAFPTDERSRTQLNNVPFPSGGYEANLLRACLDALRE
jgi:aspartyl-tRNA synthetase